MVLETFVAWNATRLEFVGMERNECLECNKIGICWDVM